MTWRRCQNSSTSARAALPIQQVVPVFKLCFSFSKSTINEKSIRRAIMPVSPEYLDIVERGYAWNFAFFLASAAGTEAAAASVDSAAARAAALESPDSPPAEPAPAFPATLISPAEAAAASAGLHAQHPAVSTRRARPAEVVFVQSCQPGSGPWEHRLVSSPRSWVLPLVGGRTREARFRYQSRPIMPKAERGARRDRRVGVCVLAPSGFKLRRKLANSESRSGPRVQVRPIS